MKFENTKVFNFEGALRGMRNPMDSWSKSDSHYANCGGKINYDQYIIGENDLALAQKLIKAGNPHDKFMRQIFISVDITASRFFWQEYSTYKIGTVENSCSTMHKIKDYPISMYKFETEDELDTTDEKYWCCAINYLEYLRQKYKETNDIIYLRKLKQALPEGFLQKRTCTLNYENVLNMVYQRETHRLIEWNLGFISWAKNDLPYSNELIFFER
jgi:hypothetical protein